jgi:hypothetical protein
MSSVCGQAEALAEAFFYTVTAYEAENIALKTHRSDACAMRARNGVHNTPYPLLPCLPENTMKKSSIYGMARGYCRGRLNLQSSTDGYGKNAHPFRPNFKWLQGALIPLKTGDLVIPECHNRTLMDGVNHLYC